MSYTTNKLISNAYYTSGVVARQFQTVSGVQFQDGLDYLNDILDEKSVDFGMIPFMTKYTFNAVVGQEEYFIPYCTQVSTLTFTLDTVRYQMTEFQKRKYFGATRANNIESLPFTWHTERTYQTDPVSGHLVNGQNLFMYFLPFQAYAMELWGVFGLTQALPNQDISLIYPRFYIAYLKYELARRICIENDYLVPPGVEKMLEYYRYSIGKATQQIDLRMEKTTTLDKGNTLNYAIVNFGGWVA